MPNRRALLSCRTESLPQVYRQFGFEPRKLGRESDPLEKKITAHVEKEFAADGGEVFRLPPRYPDWDERRVAWMHHYPPTSREEVLLVSGSAPKSCPTKFGNHILHRGLKNLIDYSRKNDIRLFYNNAAIDKDLSGWWSKLPLLKMLMVNNPGTEWIWWLDSDAVFTDMDYRFEFARYNASGYNVVMYGNAPDVYEKRSYKGINTGNFLMRNCQWSLDLLDRWASFGANLELRVKNEDLLNNYLSDRPSGWEADDQCVLVYLLISEREMWGSKTNLETSIAMSGWWEGFSPNFRGEDPAELRRSAAEKPFVTHFAGCSPCTDYATLNTKLKCLKELDRTYNFADNQVLEEYGLRHVHLNSTRLLKRPSIITTPEAVPKDKTTDFELTVIETKSEDETVAEHKVDNPKKVKAESKRVLANLTT